MKIALKDAVDEIDVLAVFQWHAGVLEATMADRTGLMTTPINDSEDVWDGLGDEIHVWWCRLDPSTEIVEYYRSLLAPDDQIRIQRLKTRQLRSRQTVAKGTLLSLISFYTNQSPHQIEIEAPLFHKPALAERTNPGGLQFSISHSTYIAVYAFARKRLLGVDVEEVVPMSDWQLLAGLCLSDYEQEWFRQLAPEAKPDTLLAIWTIKEAYLKAIGTGLTIPPASIELAFTQTEGYRLHKTPEQYNCGRTRRIFPFSPVSNFAAAVVAEAGPDSLRCFCWKHANCRIAPEP